MGRAESRGAAELRDGTFKKTVLFFAGGSLCEGSGFVQRRVLALPATRFAQALAFGKSKYE